MIENNTRFSHEKAGAVEYAMPEILAQEILKTRHGTEKNMHPDEFLIKVVNDFSCGSIDEIVEMTAEEIARFMSLA